jgi:hypothetical protein
MKSSMAQPGARVSAARTVLELSLKAVELEDLAQRLEAVEVALANERRKS